MTPNAQADIREYLRARAEAETARLKAQQTIRARGEDLARQMTEALADRLPADARVVWVGE